MSSLIHTSNFVHTPKQGYLYPKTGVSKKPANLKVDRLPVLFRTSYEAIGFIKSDHVAIRTHTSSGVNQFLPVAADTGAAGTQAVAADALEAAASRA